VWLGVISKRAMGVWPRAEEGKDLFFMTLQPGADLARLFPYEDGIEWDEPRGRS